MFTFPNALSRCVVFAFAMLVIFSPAHSDSSKIVVTDPAGNFLPGAVIVRGDGGQATSTDSNGVAWLQAYVPSGISKRTTSRTRSTDGLSVEDGRLRFKLAGRSIAGRGVPSSAHSVTAIEGSFIAAARTRTAADSFLVGWNNVVRARVLLSVVTSAVRIDTTFAEGQFPWNDTLGLGTITDARDGRVYRITKIGNATWMAENLAWNAPGSSLYQDSAESDIRYGRLYSWSSAMAFDDSCKFESSSCHDRVQRIHRGACPEGWHAPSDSDWNGLAAIVGGVKVAGSQLKAVGVYSDRSQINGFPILNAGDPYGFRAIFAGQWDPFNDVYGSGGTIGGAFWWSTTSDLSLENPYMGLGAANVVSLDYMNNKLTIASPSYKNRKYSMRCVRDE